MVDLRDDLACTCPDFTHRPGVDGCKHVLRARLETGRADVDRIRGTLAIAAVTAEEEERERESEKLRLKARRIRQAVDRLDELAEDG